MTAKRLGRIVAPFLVPFFSQAVLVTVLATALPTVWDWMNNLSTAWAMAAILGPSLALGVLSLFWVFRWYAALATVFYLPAMLFALSWWTASLAHQF